MSNELETAFIREPEDHYIGSVYDFLYYDSQRVGSFLSQFDNSGHLKDVKNTEKVNTGTRRGFSASIAGATIGLSPYSNGEEGLERTYDPLWVNALTFLDYVGEKHLLRINIKQAKIGQFVLVSGSLSLLNSMMLKPLWKNGLVRKTILDALDQSKNQGLNRQQRRQHQNNKNETKKLNEDLIDVVSEIPHMTQVTVVDDDANTIWATLKDQYLTTSSDEITLKYGISIEGRWHMIGIMDSYPSSGGSNSTEEDPLSPALFPFFSSFLDATKNLIGKNPEFYSVTPLLIFREVS